ncbi:MULTISPECIES: hypothetical protein [Sporosarcina]|uniref:hypothetical protein n=1 Tax=Sporosarcina TaxID=1569 RepID=UPI00129B8707|nr:MULTISPECIES: hypothetical protein [Sporosarcina]GKV67371.1 hypothetical protein NCCP2331_35240 [Sporosarcina sp. NCCP-2331]GLB57727.1 hypothetical protein NCCP2378_35170 [Sporosarcina sp. NCCP-2378]
MSATTVQKAKRIIEGLEYGAFITSKEWESRNFEYYFNYFSSSDAEVRKYSLLVFASGLGNWYALSAFIFKPVEELRKDPLFDPDAYYYLPDYIESFLKNREGIESEYPGLYTMIIHLLIELDNRESFDLLFPEHELFQRLREEVLNSADIGNRLMYDDFQQLLYDMGLPNFYKPQ